MRSLCVGTMRSPLCIQTTAGAAAEDCIVHNQIIDFPLIDSLAHFEQNDILGPTFSIDKCGIYSITIYFTTITIMTYN